MKPKPKLSLCYVAKSCKITRKKEVRKRFTKYKTYCKLLEFAFSLSQYNAIINQYKGAISAKNNEIAAIKFKLECKEQVFSTIKQMIDTVVIIANKTHSLNREFAKKAKFLEKEYKSSFVMLEKYYNKSL